MLLLITAALGAFMGTKIAKKKGGTRLDQLQYGTVFGIIFLVLTIGLQIILSRNGIL